MARKIGLVMLGIIIGLTSINYGDAIPFNNDFNNHVVEPICTPEICGEIEIIEDTSPVNKKELFEGDVYLLIIKEETVTIPEKYWNDHESLVIETNGDSITISSEIVTKMEVQSND